jgi:hypothetical protein
MASLFILATYRFGDPTTTETNYYVHAFISVPFINPRKWIKSS